MIIHGYRLRIRRTHVYRYVVVWQVGVRYASDEPKCAIPARAREEVFAQIDQMADHGTNAATGEIFR